MAERDIKVVLSAADEYSRTLNKFKADMNGAASSASRDTERFESASVRGFNSMKRQIMGVVAAFYTLKKGWDYAFESLKNVEEAQESLTALKNMMDTITHTVQRLAVAVATSISGVLLFAGSGLANLIRILTNWLAKLSELGEKIPWVGKHLQGVTSFLKDMSGFADESSKKLMNLSMASFKVGAAALTQGVLVKKAAKEEKERAEVSARTQEIFKEATKNYTTAEEKIRNLVFATAAIGATEQELIAIEQAKFAVTSASIDQIERYTIALQQQFEKESQLAQQKEAARLNEMAGSPETAAAKGAKTEMEVDSAGGDLWAKQRLEIQAIKEKNAIILQSAMATGASVTEIERIESENRMRIAEQEQNFKLSLASQTLGDMATIAQAFYEASGKQNKTAFAAYKAFSIAQTVIDTYKGAVAAYAAMAGIPYVGPALGVIAAAAVIAYGIMRVNQIRAMEPGQGTVAASGGTTLPITSGDMIGATTGSTPTSLTGGEQQQPVTYNVSITVVNPLGDENWDNIMEEQIAPALERYTGRGGTVELNVT